MTISAALFVALTFIQAPVQQPDVVLALTCGDQPRDLVLTLRNAGASDTAILLGRMLSNGQRYEPRELVVELTRSGRAEPEDLVFRGVSGVAGRIDHWVVPLPARAAFTMTLQSSDFVSTTQPTPSEPPAAVRIRLVGRAVTADLNVDMVGMKAWRVWTGSARSNLVQLSQCS